MLDITLFRTDQGGNPDIVRESQRRRYADVSLVDKVIEIDSEWRQSAIHPYRTLSSPLCAMLDRPNAHPTHGYMKNAARSWSA